MYISLLDYLEELKKKFYLVILMILVFLVISLGYKFYRDDHYELNYSTNLLKLSSLTLSKYNFKSSSQLAIEWIGEEANSAFNEKNKKEKLSMKCKRDLSFLRCEISGKFRNKMDEVKNEMYLAISGAFEDYENYVIGLLDDIITSKKDLFIYVEGSEDTNIETKASYKASVTEIEFTKNLFLDLIDRAKIVESDIYVSKLNTSINYILIIISGLISGFFIVFLQMTGKNKLT